MLLTIDVGNTNLTLGLFQGKKFIKELRTATAGFRTLPALPWRTIDRVVVASVVPAVDRILKRTVKKPMTFITADNIPFITVKLKDPREVGADRIVNAAAVHVLYGGPAIIVDFGTATTFCALTKKGEYLGGAIAPGINLSRIVLHERTAKLPLIELYKPATVIGGSTRAAMESGIVLGYGHMVDGIIRSMKQELRRTYGQKSITVIATGGYARLIGQVLTEKIEHIDPILTLQGLRIIAGTI